MHGKLKFLHMANLSPLAWLVRLVTNMRSVWEQPTTCCHVNLSLVLHLVVNKVGADVWRMRDRKQRQRERGSSTAIRWSTGLHLSTSCQLESSFSLLVLPFFSRDVIKCFHAWESCCGMCVNFDNVLNQKRGSVRKPRKDFQDERVGGVGSGEQREVDEESKEDSIWWKYWPAGENSSQQMKILVKILVKILARQWKPWWKYWSGGGRPSISSSKPWDGYGWVRPAGWNNLPYKSFNKKSDLIFFITMKFNQYYALHNAHLFQICP